MKIKKVVLENFRCFKHLEIDLDDRLTVLVAENGGGKTAILDAIAIGLGQWFQYFDTASQRLPFPEIADNDFHILGTYLNGDSIFVPEHSNHVKISLVAKREEDPGDLSWETLRQWSNDQEVKKKYGQKELRDIAILIRDRVYARDYAQLIPVFAYYGIERGVVKVPERLHQTKIDYSQRFSGLVDALYSGLDFPEFLRWFKDEHYEEMQEILASSQSKFPTEPHESVYLKTIRMAISSFLGNKVSNPRFQYKKFIVDFLDKNKNIPLQVDQLSQGYQTAFAMATDFAKRMVILNPGYQKDLEAAIFNESIDVNNPILMTPLGAPAIMLIDEVDLHLHPSWQQRVLSDLMRTFPNTQFIVTTHSPQVLTTVDCSSIRIIKPENGIPTVRIPDYQTKGVESVDVLLEIMGVNPIPQIEEAKWVCDYRSLIEVGMHESEQGVSLYDKLITHFGKNHPIIIDCERLIRFHAFKKRQHGSSK